LFVVFLLTGIWHGASWHFVIWGIWNAFFILLERYISTKTQNTAIHKGRDVALKIYTLLIVNLGWVLFRAPTIKKGMDFIGIMMGIIKPINPGFTIWWYLDRWTMSIMIIAIICSSSFPNMMICRIKGVLSDKVYQICKYLFLLCMFYFSIMRIVSGTYNPFIYFQF